MSPFEALLSHGRDPVLVKAQGTSFYGVVLQRTRENLQVPQGLPIDAKSPAAPLRTERLTDATMFFVVHEPMRNEYFLLAAAPQDAWDSVQARRLVQRPDGSVTTIAAESVLSDAQAALSPAFV